MSVEQGAAGAVDHVKYEDGKWNYTTAGNKPAVGLCGSGLIDLVAGLLDAGMLDENGVLRSGQEKQGVFILVLPERGGNERGVYLTQKDLERFSLWCRDCAGNSDAYGAAWDYRR